MSLRIWVSIAAMTLMAVGVVMTPPTAEAKAQKCGKVMGVYKVKAKRVSCTKARRVAKQYQLGESPRGWECRWTKPGHTRCAQGHGGGVVMITESYGGSDRAVREV